MMTKVSRPRTIPAAVTLCAAFALSACGGDESKGQAGQGGGSGVAALVDQAGWNYDFTNTKVAKNQDVAPMLATSNPFTITLPEELVAARAEGSGAVAVKSYSITTKAFGTGTCRMDGTITYNEGGKDMVRADQSGDSEMTESERVGSRLLDRRSVEVVDQLPADDELAMRTKSYITKDYSKFTSVGDCSEDGEDDLGEVRFPYLNPKGTVRRIASADIAVLQGSGTSATTMVVGYTPIKVSATGKWLKAER
ncbi:hypothetical protein ACMYYO_09905 [Dermacoccaceae bacterium W4C1]